MYNNIEYRVYIYIVTNNLRFSLPKMICARYINQLHKLFLCEFI